MFSKSKLKKLGTQLKSMGFSMEQLAVETGTKHKVKVWRVLQGTTYDKDIVAKLVELRNEKLQEIKAIESAI